MAQNFEAHTFFAESQESIQFRIPQVPPEATSDQNKTEIKIQYHLSKHYIKEKKEMMDFKKKPN